MKKLLLLIALLQITLFSFGQSDKDKYIIHTNDNIKHQSVAYSQDTLIIAMDVSHDKNADEVLNDSTFLMEHSDQVMNKMADDISYKRFLAMQDSGFSYIKQVYYVDDKFYTIGKWKVDELLRIKS